jgi:hypothetical protein
MANFSRVNGKKGEVGEKDPLSGDRLNPGPGPGIAAGAAKKSLALAPAIR